MSAPRHDRRLLVAIVLVTTVACGFVALTNRGSGGSSASASGMIATSSAGDAATGSLADGSIALTSPDADAAAATDSTGPDDASAATAVTEGAAVEGEDLDGAPSTGEGCRTQGETLRVGSTGESVTCLQTALADAGFYSGPVNGTFDQATYAAVEELQSERNLFVDGVAGRESGLSLGIWPDEASAVIHTPAPAPGAVDLWGYPLSSVATSGPDAPPLPENSGHGKRLVYQRLGQRVWAVDDDETVIRSWLVTGSQYNNEVPGTWEVYSRSDPSTAWNGKALLPKMVRYYKTAIGNIGFHSIPLHVSDGSPYQTEAELGQRLSGGCQRQAVADANFTWDFAQVGTTVVVL